MDRRTARATRPLSVLIGLGLLLYLLAPAPGPPVSSAQATVGTPLVWGADDLGQLGDGATTDRITPGPPTGLTNVTALAGNGDLSMALKSDGTVWTWGSNSQNGTTADGQLGRTSADTCGATPCGKTPGQVLGLPTILAIAAGRFHGVALANDGSVWTWGANDVGQLGNNCTIGVNCANRTTPGQVVGPNGLGLLGQVTAIAANGAHTLARRTDGSLWAWGNNGEGQLGNNTTTSSSFPVQVHGPANVGFLTNVSGNVNALAVGNDSSMAITLDPTTMAPTLWAWGRAGEGQLGNGCTLGATCTGQLTPVQVVGPGGTGTLSGVTAIAAGTIHALAVRSDGTAWGWGDNVRGELGNGAAGSAASTSIPVQVSGLSGATAVAAGFAHSLALKTDGTVWAWGLNNSGQLGTGTPISICNVLLCSTTPVQVRGPGGVGFLSAATAVAVSRNHSMALTTSTATLTATPKSAPAGGSFTAAWSGIASPTAGDFVGLYAPGAADAAFLVRLFTGGTASGNLAFGVPGSVTPGIYQLRLFSNNTFSRLATSDYVLVTAPAGAARAWGLNNKGQLGNGTTTDAATPVPAAGLTNVTALAGGNSHSLALKTDGTVAAWGLNDAGQLGASTGGTCSGSPCSTTPVAVSGLTNVMALAAGASHSLALKTDGTVWAWGSNGSGQLGNGCTIGGTCANSATPLQVVGPAGTGTLSEVLAIAAGSAHSLALRADGTVYAWGNNGDGQLGNNTPNPSSFPVQVLGPGGAGLLNTVIGLAGGDSHSLALKLDGTVWAWGFNSDGQLGNGCTVGSTCSDSLTPLQVSGLSGAIAVAAGKNHSLALRSDATVRAWGLAAQGQLGNGCTLGVNCTDVTTPVAVSGLSGVTFVAAGGFHSLALKSDGTAWAWGNNGSGQLGNGSQVSSSVPVAIGLAGLVSLAGGQFHTLGDVALSTCILGDINCDGIVDIRDYGIWRANFGATACGNPADLNLDCLVDILDYGIWRANFGHTAPGTPLNRAPPALLTPGTAAPTPTRTAVASAAAVVTPTAMPTSPPARSSSTH